MTALVHWVWQGLLVAAATSLALRAWPRLNGATRHALWWVALATVVALPLAWPVELTNTGAPPLAASPAPEAGFVLPAVPGWLGAVLFAAWLSWVALGLARIGAGVSRLRRLCEGARELPPRLHEAVEVARGTNRGGRRVDVRVSREIRGACAVGFGRHVILLSEGLVAALAPDAVAQVVLHEEAHLDRGDHWGRLVQSLVEATAGLHPAVAYVLGRIELEREVACDERVVAQTRAARDYARSLVDAAEVEARARASRLPAVAPGATRSPGWLRVRVEHLLASPHGGPVDARRPAVAGGALAGLLSFGAAASLPPAVVFADLVLEGPRAALAPIGSYLPSLPGFAPVAAAPASWPVVVPARRRSLAGGRVGLAPAAATSIEQARVVTAVAEPVADTVALESRATAAFAMVAPFTGDSVPAPAPTPGAWSGAATAGRAMGQAAERSGAAIGDAAGRGGSAIGRGAKRTAATMAGFFARPF